MIQLRIKNYTAKEREYLMITLSKMKMPCGERLINCESRYCLDCEKRVICQDFSLALDYLVKQFREAIK